MNIVAVDHEATALADLTQKLRATFPESVVKSYNNPIEPLQFAQRNKIDLLFTDVRLKPFDGYELVKILSQTQNMYSYVVSGSREKPDDLSWMKVNGTFTKPITMEELAKIRDGLTLQKAASSQKEGPGQPNSQTKQTQMAPKPKPPAMGR